MGGRFQKGQSGNPAGRKPKAQLPSRNELLELLITTKGRTHDTLLEDAIERFHEILATSNSSAAIEWLFNQLIGSPKSTIKQELADFEVTNAYAECMAELGYTEEQAKALTEAVIKKLKRD